ncbi:hypothetical protein BDV59DRAFT_202885 [Aspergillus ambiguus]|uniref:Zn(II)2Cys6 transcription factor domain-containing protein n=1 Tax=Aspergillus ambiguus TaxID=176160 RepID=UPI003CCDFF62
MSTRKVHTKSRYGCDWCRKRKVRCDEQGPPCNNCILREIDNCVYSRVPPAQRLALARGSAPSSLARGPNLSQGRDVVDELELMHMFATQTYQSMSVNAAEFPVWQMEVPRLALEHRFLVIWWRRLFVLENLV